METHHNVAEVTALTDVVHANADAGRVDLERFIRDARHAGRALRASRRFPESPNCYSENLVLRAAEVILKDRRTARAARPGDAVHAGHVRLLDPVTASGVVVMRPVPAF